MIKIHTEYSPKKFCRVTGKNVKPMVPPRTAPHIGAPIPQTWVVKIPKTDKMIVNQDFPTFLFILILSFVFLKIQVTDKAVVKIKV